jgi:hypothetical protein
MQRLIFALVSSAFVSSSAMAQLAAPKVKTLATAADPLEKAILIGRVATGDIQMGRPYAKSERTLPRRIQAHRSEVKDADSLCQHHFCCNKS